MEVSDNELRQIAVENINSLFSKNVCRLKFIKNVPTLKVFMATTVNHGDYVIEPNIGDYMSEFARFGIFISSDSPTRGKTPKDEGYVITITGEDELSKLASAGVIFPGSGFFDEREKRKSWTRFTE